MSAPGRVLLVRHGPTAAVHAKAFPLDEPLTEQGRTDAARLAERLPAGDAVLSSPARRCRETAAAAGYSPRVDVQLREYDFGRWRGHTLAEINERDPEGVRAWMLDPTATPHGGENLSALLERAAAWLAEHREQTTIAFTHAGFIRAAVAHATGAGTATIWTATADPLSVTELLATPTGWRVAS